MNGTTTHVNHNTINPALERQVRNELAPNEKLLWTAQPLPWRFAKQGIPIMIFGIPFTAFAIFWMAGASMGASHAPGPFAFFPLFGLPFLLAGLSMLTSPLWMRRKAAGTAYAVTSERVLILEGTLTGGTSVRSIAPPQLLDRIRNQNADGIGDLIFPRVSYGSYNQTRSSQSTPNIGFYGIPNVKSVDDLISLTFEGRPPS